MRSSTDTTTKTMLVLALLAALAVLLRLGENLLPLPVQLGVIRPGLANTITILCLYLFGLRLTGLFLTVRVLLVGLLSTGLFTPGFLIGLGGTLLSLLLVAGCGKSAATLPTVIGSGNVDIPAYKITAPAAGKILGLILESGERIGKGQPLFAIEQPELDAAVEDAATEATRADAELTNLESGSVNRP